jgi:hypothetical protein
MIRCIARTAADEIAASAVAIVIKKIDSPPLLTEYILRESENATGSGSTACSIGKT